LGTESRGVPRVDTPYRLPVRIGSERCNPAPKERTSKAQAEAGTPA